jgi:triosephosphate isomerase
MAKRIVIANWKMNLLRGEAKELANHIVNNTSASDLESVNVILAPTFTSLEAVGEIIEDSAIELCAQNVFWEQSGAYTGEISADMLLDLGCRWVIIGHSERRYVLGETNSMINDKILFSLKKGLKVIFCIGERIEEKNQGKTLSVIKKQVEIGLNGVNNQLFDDIIFAYEPVWAIGTGITAEPQQASSVHLSIKEFIAERFNCHISKIRVMYGGSVNSGNIDCLISQPNIDGVLVGGASLNKKSFLEIIKSSGV